LSRYYPVYLKLKGRKCVVIGGGEVARRKVEALLAAGAKVWLVSPEITPELSKLAEKGDITHLNRKYLTGDLEDAFLVIGATDEENINRRVAEDGARAGILVNIVDAPELCNFIVPSTVMRGDLILSISTGGNSPALAKQIRKQLEQLYGEEYAEYVKLLGRCRKLILQRIPDMAQRRRIFQALIDSDLIELIKQRNRDKIRQRIKEIVGFGVEGI
jgi:precorrin-2 dehydrogenase/sirohydrochlorin ferrochelatase